jgi:hypothetical protein
LQIIKKNRTRKRLCPFSLYYLKNSYLLGVSPRRPIYSLTERSIGQKTRAQK